jgi:hypothetical protein
MPFKNPHPLYSVWRGMRRRCLTRTYKQWADYGGRGIKICSRWDSFHAFVEDMGPRPEGHSLDRIDNDGDYTPDNCRWADRKTQQRNQRRAVYVSIEGKRYRALYLAQIAGVKTDTVTERAARGLPLAKVIAREKLHDLSGLALGGLASGAKKRAKTHCRNGHSFSEGNTGLTKEGYRYCKRCHADLEANRRKSRIR